MSRIAVFSNKLPYDFKTGNVSAGGLTVGVEASISGSSAIWIGWSGEIIESEDQRDLDSLVRKTVNGIEYVGIPLTREEYEGYYLEYANGKLWPAMHSLEQYISRSTGSYEIYQRVNKVFAQVAKKELKDTDKVSVHDYHLIPLGGEMRKLGITNSTAFFCHIPIPDPKFFKRDGVSKKLKAQFGLMITALDQYDQAGFQAPSDFRNLQKYKFNNDPIPPNFQTATIGSGSTKYGVFPISVETADIPDIVQRIRETDDWFQRFEAGLGTKKLGMSADRTDFSKLILERIDAISASLRSKPQLYGAVQFYQALPPTREDLDIYKNYMDAVKSSERAFQEAFSTPVYSPMQTEFGMVPRDRLFALYNLAGRSGGIGLVSSNYEGQHLGALEAVAAQDPAKPIALVLGKNTGAAQQLGDNGAILINPYDRAGFASAITRAFEMPSEERVERHATMLPIIQNNDARHWGQHALFASCNKN